MARWGLASFAQDLLILPPCFHRMSGSISCQCKRSCLLNDNWGRHTAVALCEKRADLCLAGVMRLDILSSRLFPLPSSIGPGALRPARVLRILE